MRTIKLYEIIGLALLLGLTVFAGVSCSKANATQDLSGVTWVLKAYGDPEALVQVVPDKETTLIFDAGKMTVSGSGGVNGYGGDYSVKGTELKFTGVIHTLIASQNQALNEQENGFFKILNSAESYKIKAKQMMITGSEGVLVFEQK